MTEKRVHNLEIDMSTLSNVQKTMCVKLLAESNVKFEELENRFVAQIRIDPAKLQQTNLLNVKNKNSAKK